MTIDEVEDKAARQHYVKLMDDWRIEESVRHAELIMLTAAELDVGTAGPRTSRNRASSALDPLPSGTPASTPR